MGNSLRGGIWRGICVAEITISMERVPLKGNIMRDGIYAAGKKTISMERVPLKGNDNLVRGCLSIT